jgi:hypothetical protein
LRQGHSRCCCLWRPEEMLCQQSELLRILNVLSRVRRHPVIYSYVAMQLEGTTHGPVYGFQFMGSVCVEEMWSLLWQYHGSS